MFLQKLTIFNIYHVFTPVMKLCWCRFLYFSNLCDVKNEAVFLLLEHSSPRGVKQKNHIKKPEILVFKPLLQDIRLKNLTSRKIFWSSNIYGLKFKKNKCCQSLPKWSKIEFYSPPFRLIKNLWQIHSRDSHVEFTGKNKVGNTTWAKLRGLIGQKWQHSFQ